MNNKYRNPTTTETVELEQNGNSAEDWSKVWVAEPFSPKSLRGNRFEGEVRIGSDCTITDSLIVAYTIGAKSTIRRSVLLTEGETHFGNGTKVATINECGGRKVAIFDTLSAQYAYILALYRYRHKAVAAAEALAEAYISARRATQGCVGEGCRIEEAKRIRNASIGNGVEICGASLVEEATLLDGCRIGSDVKILHSIVAQGAKVNLGAICRECFIGENSIVEALFTAENSLIFANCHLGGGEAVSIFAGPHTVSHHKSTLLIAGMFSFYNAGSGTNQSNHLFKGGAVHQAIHTRGVKTASNAYIMAPAIEGPFTMVMGRHTKHHSTLEMPFSYLIESKGVSMLLPGMALRSYGTMRDTAKWPERDSRSVKRDRINYEKYNPYITALVIKGRNTLTSLRERHPSEEYFHYNNTTIKASMAQFGLKFYNEYIAAALGAMLSVGGKPCDKGRGEWVDMAGQFLPKSEVDRLLAEAEQGAFADVAQIEARLDHLASLYTDMAYQWACDVVAKELGRTPTTEDLNNYIAAGHAAEEALNRVALSDMEQENSLGMSVGYGMDSSTDEERWADFCAVRGL